MKYEVLNIWRLEEVLARLYPIWTQAHAVIRKRFSPNFTNIFHIFPDIFGKKSAICTGFYKFAV